MITKTTDSKGRISLGRRFANRTFIIEEMGDMELKLLPARIIPERESWLYENEEAEASVQRGLAQAKAGRFSKTPPNLDADQALVEELEDME
jgi:hypothetical protein